MSVAEIESAIAQLSTTEFAELTAWFEEYHNRAWDRQIADDLAAGRLDAVIAQAENEL